MAAKKVSKAAAPGRKAAGVRATPPAKKASPKRASARKSAADTVQAAAVAAPARGAGDSQRLMREAAWSRMFGRAEAKNPFAR